jgi:hypothetical protein
MDKHHKYAYRYLLYWATLDIRSIHWLTFRNPFRWRSNIQRVRQAGAIADWLHNLALFSALDFERFDENQFWRDGRVLKEHFPAFDLACYQQLFERQMLESQNAVPSDVSESRDG